MHVVGVEIEQLGQLRELRRRARCSFCLQATARDCDTIHNKFIMILSIPWWYIATTILRRPMAMIATRSSACYVLGCCVAGAGAVAVLLLLLLLGGVLLRTYMAPVLRFDGRVTIVGLPAVAADAVAAMGDGEGEADGEGEGAGAGAGALALAPFCGTPAFEAGEAECALAGLVAGADGEGLAYSERARLPLAGRSLLAGVDTDAPPASSLGAVGVVVV